MQMARSERLKGGPQVGSSSGASAQMDLMVRGRARYFPRLKMGRNFQGKKSFFRTGEIRFDSDFDSVPPLHFSITFSRMQPLSPAEAAAFDAHVNASPGTTRPDLLTQV